MKVAMQTYTDGRGQRIAKQIRSDVKIRFGVFVGVHFISELKNLYDWADTPRGLDIRDWLKDNISGRYAVQPSHVYFENHDDALLCYLRFKD